MNTIEDAFYPYLNNMTLLCVEDSKTIQLIYKNLFEIVFKEIIIVDNGLEALEAIKNNSIDIIITDHLMPKMNGLEMLEALKSLHNETPVVFVTAIDEAQVIINALNLGVHNFLHKPFDISELNESVINAAKIVIANATMQKNRLEHSKLLEDKEYQIYQEELSFRKELTILRNDFYYQRHFGKRELLIDLLYMPLDILSGDAYSARRVSDHKTLFFITDGMGKGLSASLSAMLMTSFMNHLIDIALQDKRDFDLEALIQRCIVFIQKVLLDEEILSAEFILIDESTQILHYALFSMPSLLLHYKDDSIRYIKSNNPPINKYHTNVTISSFALDDVQKMLFLSDGLVENSVENALYYKYIEEDFKASFTREEFKKAVFSHIKEQEDDITFIFLNYFDVPKIELFSQSFSSTLENVDKANAWYEESVHSIGLPLKLLNKATLTFNELFMNAFEHGSLHIDNKEKEHLIAEDSYFDYLKKASSSNTKLIHVNVSKLVYNTQQHYLVTTIDDEGEGFDTQLLSTIFRNREKYNGRGVFISRKACDGIYYSKKGNSVLFLHRIS